MMDDHSGKRFPLPSPESKPYWEACKRHQLQIQKCSDCGHYQFYPRIICSACTGRNLRWVTTTGRGKITSYTIITRAVSKGYEADVPYVVALVKLEEGPTMMSNIVNCAHGNLSVGMRVSVLFEDWSEEISVPKFQPEI